jgi:hypothetical protein
MAFKRSAVRSRLSPPKETATERWLFLLSELMREDKSVQTRGFYLCASRGIFVRKQNGNPCGMAAQPPYRLSALFCGFSVTFPQKAVDDG